MKTLAAKIALSFALLFTGVLFANSIPTGDDEICYMLVDDTSSVAGSKTIGEVTLADAKTCENIVSHAPVLNGSSFSKEVGKVWVYSRFTMDKEISSNVKHVYFFNGKKISEVNLKVKGPSFRTNSYKTITKNMVGSWKVEIQADNGEIFETLNFTITE